MIDSTKSSSELKIKLCIDFRFTFNPPISTSPLQHQHIVNALQPSPTHKIASLLFQRLPLGSVGVAGRPMNSTVASLRRSLRAATRGVAVAAGGTDAEPAAAAALLSVTCEQAAAGQPRKRQRKSLAAGDDAASTAAAQQAAMAPKRAAKPTAEGPSRALERELWQQGYARVAGVDEAGRGPLAGARAAATPPHLLPLLHACHRLCCSCRLQRRSVARPPL
jgi:hypothetical protein